MPLSWLKRKAGGLLSKKGTKQIGSNWGLQRGLTAPNLGPVLLPSLLELTSFLGCKAAYFQAVLILWTPEEAEDDVEDEENYTPS